MVFQFEGSVYIASVEVGDKGEKLYFKFSFFAISRPDKIPLLLSLVELF